MMSACFDDGVCVLIRNLVLVLSSVNLIFGNLHTKGVLGLNIRIAIFYFSRFLSIFHHVASISFFFN